MSLIFSMLHGLDGFLPLLPTHFPCAIRSEIRLGCARALKISVANMTAEEREFGNKPAQ
jgi:hypothetical protein